MVGMMNSRSRERLTSLVKSLKVTMDLHSKLGYLRQLKQDLRQSDPVFLSECLPQLFDLLSDQFGPVRKIIIEMIGEIGLKNLEYLPEIVPVLITVLDDDTPAVGRQAITCGIDFFRCTLENIAIQGLHSSELDSSHESAWAWMLKFKDEIFSIAFQPGSDRLKLLALKFVEVVILLYTPDPSSSSEPPLEGNLTEFNISWLRGGHPVLNVGDLSIEASQRLGLLVDQLRFPTVKSLSSSVVIVLINSLLSIAKKRPAYYGRILPVLLGMDPPRFVIKGVHVYAAHYALKKAFLSCLKCTHPAATPWRERLVGALREMQTQGFTKGSTNQGLKSNGSLEEKDKSPVIKETKPSVIDSNTVHSNLERKRSGPMDSSDLPGVDMSGKRSKPTPRASEESSKEFYKNVTLSQDGTASAATRVESDTGPAQQLVAMFGALVAQGEKAVGSLEILISSISADLLAEVVMANMRNLSRNQLNAEEGDEELVVDMSIVGCDSQVKYPPSFLAGVVSLSSSFPPIASLLDSHQSISDDTVKAQSEEELNAHSVVPIASEAEIASLLTDLAASSDVALADMETDELVTPYNIIEVGNLENEIPGLDSARHDGLSETIMAASFLSTDVEDSGQEQVMSMSGRSTVDMVPTISTDRSEELSPKAAVVDSITMASSTATSANFPSPIVLPKMSAPVIDLADEQRDNLQKLIFKRIIEAYKQISIAGGLQVRFSLLAFLGVEFPLEMNPWELLQKHILDDYMTHGGHELTLRVLYRLYGEAEEEHDFFSSTTAASVYETFLLAVAEGLRDSFPPSDKSLSRLLGDAPYLPKSVLKMLEGLCCPGNCDTSEKEVQGGDRVTQGLSAVWSLILLRPNIREVCLQIALQSAVHHLEEVRMKAIRLVANKLYPLTSIKQHIEDFAREMVLSLINGDAAERTSSEGPINESQKDPDSVRPKNEHQSVSVIGKDISLDTNLSSTSESTLPEAQRCMSLYFALCTKKHSLFRHIFVIYGSTSKAVKQAINRHIPILVRTMGSSSELLEIISDPPTGSEDLLIQVLHTLTDGIVPSPELIFTIRKLFGTKVKDVEILFPILPFLPRDEVMQIFPHFVNLPAEKFQVALARLMQESAHSGQLLSPAEVLIAIHGIDPDRDGIPLKKVTDACNACFEQRQIFTQQVIAKVLNQLVEQIPLPLLFMRTVLQAIGAYPALVEFILDILARLVSKQIWKYPKLWVGFLKCALLIKPQSFSVLLKLPPPQLENALNRVAALKAPLVAHASQPDIRSSLSRSALVVLGIVSDSQASSQAQTSQPQTIEGQTSQAQSSHTQTNQAHTNDAQSGEAQSSQAQTNEVHNTQADRNDIQSSQMVNDAESNQAPTSQAQSIEAHSSQAQSLEAQSSQAHSLEAQSSQAHSLEAQSSQALSLEAQSSQALSIEAQSSQAQAGDTANSDAVVTEKSKESSDAS